MEQLVLEVNVGRLFRGAGLELLLGLDLVPLLLEGVEGLLKTVFEKEIAEKVVDLFDSVYPWRLVLLVFVCDLIGEHQVKKDSI